MAGAMPPIAKQGEHARVEVVERDSVSTCMLALLRDARHGTPEYLNRKVISRQLLIFYTLIFYHTGELCGIVS